MLDGGGRFFSKTQGLKETSLGREKFFPGEYLDFSIDIKTNPKKARAMREGKIVTVSSSSGSEEVELTIGFEHSNKSHLEFGFQEIFQDSSNVLIPIWKQSIVDPSGEIVDADLGTIPVVDESELYVYVNEHGTNWGEARDLAKSNAAPQNVEEYQYDKTNSKLVFDPAFIGAPITYLVPKRFSTSSQGYEQSAITFGAQSFWGLGIGPDYPAPGVYIHLPKVVCTQKPSFKFEEGVPKWEMKFEALTPPNLRQAYQLHFITA